MAKGNTHTSKTTPAKGAGKGPSAPATDKNSVTGAPDGLGESNKPSLPEGAPPAPDQTQNKAGAGEMQDKQPDPGKGEPVVTHFRIAALTDGFRRCGRAWPAAGVEVSVEDLAEGDIERLIAEPELVVTPIAKDAE